MVHANNDAYAKRLGIAVIVWLGIWAVTFHKSLLSAASVWITNDTFNHCFLVLPGALYAIWQQRGALLASRPRYSVLGALLMMGCLAVFSIGSAAYIDVLQHLAVFALLPSMVLMLFGIRVTSKIALPLLFILFSIPIGEELMPMFQGITADIAIALLKALNVPVYRSGLYITVPNGNFVVAEACSGVRFFIACVVIGFAYAYLNFRSRWRAVAFAMFSIALPILANGVRAFGIIYIGHITNMEHAAGADHIIYGWFFFALVVALLIAAGHFFSDGTRAWANSVDHIDDAWQTYSPRKVAVASALPLAVAIAIALVVAQHRGPAFTLPMEQLDASESSVVHSKSWTPRLTGVDEYRLGFDRSSGARIVQAIFAYNREASEMISWANRIYDIEQWSQQGEYSLAIEAIGTLRVLDLTSLRFGQRMVAYWYVTPARIDSSGTRIKLQQAINTLLFKPSGGALIVVSLSYNGQQGKALQSLEDMLKRRAGTLSGIE